jgi:hypothetical protein
VGYIQSSSAGSGLSGVLHTFGVHTFVGQGRAQESGACGGRLNIAHCDEGAVGKISVEREPGACEGRLTHVEISRPPQAPDSRARKGGYVKMPFNAPEGYESHPQDIDMGKYLPKTHNYMKR